MRVLLVQPTSLLRSIGGATTSNRLLMQAFAHAGHQCHALTLARESTSSQTTTPATTIDQNGNRTFLLGDIVCTECHNPRSFRNTLSQVLNDFAPDWVLVSSEDATQVIVRAVGSLAPERMIYLARTPLTFPFGPAAYYRAPYAADLIRNSRSILTVSKYMEGYIREWLGVDAHALPISPFPKPAVDYTERPKVPVITMVNPCPLKGESIFYDLVRRFPSTRFLAVRGWGDSLDRSARLAAAPNLELTGPTADMEAIWARTSILLVPSIWIEAWGRVVTEAMLRGIPVITSDSGGLPEAKLGVPYVIPVNLVSAYEASLDGNGIPVPVVPDQNLAPWQSALADLLSDSELYGYISEASYNAARSFVKHHRADKVLDYLERL